MIEVVNAPQFRAAIAMKAKKLGLAIDAATKKTAMFVRMDAARNTPRGKGYPGAGDLNESWEGPIPVGHWAYEVRNNSDHAMFAEKGFMLTQGGLAAMAVKGMKLPETGQGVPRPIAGRHMLGQAVHRAEPMHKAAIRAAIRTIL